jgi:gas vesicle protein
VEVVVGESTKGGFLAGVLVGAAAGLLLAPRCGRQPDAGGYPDIGEAAEESPAAAHGGNDRSEALKVKIEETRRRLREQVGMPPE